MASARLHNRSHDTRANTSSLAQQLRTTLSAGCVEGWYQYSYGGKLCAPLQQRTASPLPPPRTLHYQPPTPAAQLLEVNATTTCGDTLVVVGSAKELGCWDVYKGLRMETDATSYPIWHVWVKGCLPACEYKFAVLKASGEVEWEQTANRKLRPLTNRVAAIFGDTREVARTCAMDAELVARRKQVLNSLETATSYASPVTASTSPVDPAQQPHKPMMRAASPLGLPPHLTIGASLKPFQEHPGGASVESSPCVSRLSSRSASDACLHRSVSQQSHSSLQRNGSRISFAENLNICY